MSEQQVQVYQPHQMALDPRSQAISDYMQGGGVNDCPKSYDDIDRCEYLMQMHRLQRDELTRMQEAM